MDYSISGSFPISRGTRQGCPPSPLLFALAIEPLGELLRSSSSVNGLVLGGLEELVSIYADNMFIYLANPQSSLPTLLCIIQDFCHYSGFRVNCEKSLLFLLDQAASVALPSSCPLKIVTSFRYLGIIVQQPISLYIKNNLDPLIRKLKSTLKIWAKLPLTLLGRINIFKIIFLTCFLYILSNSQVYIPKRIFQEIDSILTSFIWGGRASDC